MNGKYEKSYESENGYKEEKMKNERIKEKKELKVK
jgi:hypothetical protein